MLKIFRTDIFMQAVIILIVSLVMWIGVFLHPQPIPIDGGGPLFYWITGFMSPRMGAIVAFLLVIAEGFIFNGILYRHKMITQNTLMPMLFYIVAMSLGSPTLTPILIGSLLLILAIGQLMLTTTLLSLTLDKIFGAAALVSLATLFCPSMAVFFIPLVIDMFTYSLYGWRDWAMLILGLLAPLILVETIYFVTDEIFYRNYLLLYDLTDLHFRAHGNWVDWAGSILFAVILVVGLGAAMVNSQNRNVNFKKNITAILIFTIGSIFFSLYSSLIPIPTQAYAIPFACSTTSIFIEPKRKEFVSSLFFIFIIVSGIVLNYL
jgi:hypothetical protein